MEEAAFQVVRFFHYLAVATLFGASLFPLYAFDRRRYPVPPPQVARPLPWAIAGLVTACLWLLLSVANMADAFGALAERDTWRSVFFDTGFGRVWATRMGIAAAIVCVCSLQRAPVGSARPTVAVAILSGVLLATLSGVGHAQVEQGAAGAIHVGMDALHLLAAGAWLGGLLALSATLQKPRANYGPTTLARFSGVGLLAVATLVATGLVNSWFLVGTMDGLLTSRYGHLLIAKLGAFLGMVALAAANRFWLAPAIEAMPQREGHNARLKQLERNVLGELGLGAAVLMVVGVLGTLQPAAH